MLKYSLKDKEFENIQHYNQPFDLFGIQIPSMTENVEPILEYYLKQSNVSYTLNDRFHQGISFQMLNFNHIEKDCILVIINCYQINSYISKYLWYHKQWFGIFNCTLNDFTNYGVIQTRDFCSNHFCTLYKNWLLVAYSSQFCLHVSHMAGYGIIDSLKIYKLNQDSGNLPTNKTAITGPAFMFNPNAHRVDIGHVRPHCGYLQIIHDCAIVDNNNNNYINCNSNYNNKFNNNSINTDDEHSKYKNDRSISRDNTFEKVTLIYYGKGLYTPQYCVILCLNLKFPSIATIAAYGCNVSNSMIDCKVDRSRFYNCNETVNYSYKYDKVKHKVWNDNRKTLYSNFVSFVFQHDKKQYLIFMGGNCLWRNGNVASQTPVNHVTYFDLISKQWHMSKYNFENMKIPVGKYCGSKKEYHFIAYEDFKDWNANARITKINNSAFFLCGMTNLSNCNNLDWQLISIDISNKYYLWNICRLLWIGYHKNLQNKKCYIALLPKEVIQYISLFLGDIAMLIGTI